MQKKIKYLQLKPKPETVLAKLPWTGRKRPIILFTFEDGSTKTLNIQHVDLRENPEKAIQVGKKILDRIQTDLALRTFNIKQYFPELNTITLKEFFGTYLEHRSREVERGNISEGTRQADADYTKLFISITGENTKIAAVNKNTIQHFVDTLLETETRYGTTYSPTTINIHLRTLSSAFTHAVKEGIIDHNPFISFPKLDTENTSRHMEPHEVEAMRAELSASSVSWHLDFFEFGLLTGLRRSEMLSANLNNLKKESFDGREVLLLKVIGDVKGSKRFKQKWRWVPVDQASHIIEKRSGIINDPGKLNAALMSDALDKVHRQRADEGYLFFEISSKNSVSEFFRTARKNAGLDKKLTIHSLRHTFAVRYLEEERGDIYSLSRILGHSDVKTTEIYLSATPKLLMMRGQL